MIDVAFLNDIRFAELARVQTELRLGAQVLELGAGTGAQAQKLAAQGYYVTAIDLASSFYAVNRIFPVTDYDGRNIPLANDSVDIVFSSNVLEHVEDLPKIFSECRRVTRAGGYQIHLMPSVAWRFWTFAVGPFAALKYIALLLLSILRPVGSTRTALLKSAVAAMLPLPHGTSKEGVSELWTFSRASWSSKFRRAGLLTREIKPVGLFYTGHMLLGRRLSLTTRAKLARVLGSAAHLYHVDDVDKNSIA